MKTVFTKLNDGWNAEPNAPEPNVTVVGSDVLLNFLLNPYLYRQFQDGDIGILRFRNCSRYHLKGTNDEGWSRGQCRFSKIAPAWGEYYELEGDLKLSECRAKWETVSTDFSGSRHFLFYFRDETFECDADEWLFEPSNDNALLTRSFKLS